LGGNRPSPVDASLFRSVFRRHATGVAVVTAQGTRPAGFTATSLTSLSADPPLLSFGIDSSGSSWPTVGSAEHVGVHILSEEQAQLAARFARSGADRFAAPTSYHTGPHGVPVLDDVLALLVCRVVTRVPAGDHILVITEPVHAEYRESGRPLLYFHGQYAALRS